MMRGPIPCSVNILTRNSAQTLDAALTSVAEFAEVIVGDGASSDATVSIAERHGCRVLEQDPSFTDRRGRLRDYAAARSQLLEASTQEWILYLDSDEMLDADAPAAIARLLQSCQAPEVGAYRLTGQHLHAGTRLDDGIGYPMQMQRLFRRSALDGFRGVINEQGVLAEGYVVRDLDATFLIPLPPLRTVARKWARYVRVLADEARAREADWTDRQVAVRRSSIRWVARGWADARRRGSPNRMPARYEAARVGFALVQYLALALVRVTQRVARSR
jgi:glycosyltransferase involved in cell wall biosynthesis